MIFCFFVFVFCFFCFVSIAIEFFNSFVRLANLQFITRRSLNHFLHSVDNSFDLSVVLDRFVDNLVDRCLHAGVLAVRRAVLSTNVRRFDQKHKRIVARVAKHGEARNLPALRHNCHAIVASISENVLRVVDLDEEEKKDVFS